ncbi:MAG TPA: ATP-binding protein [Nannocystaceae bacterium]|nr:ATP-binding protein [Nannocystaceae bacterium]
MTDLLERLLAPVLRRALRVAPVVVVSGARQTGKSTLVEALARRRYVTLDDLDMLERAEREPDALLRDAEALTIDEVQRAPSLLLAVKRAVDRKRTPGRFVLTGSANLRLMKAASESLAGRVAHLTLLPLTRREQLGQGTAGLWDALLDARDDRWPDVLRDAALPRADWRALARRGGYPTPALELEDAEDRALWFGGYVQTYLERDLRELSVVSSLVDFRRLMRAACLRIGNLVNQTELGRDVGLPQPTVRRHLALLELSYQLVTVPAYATNRTKRVIKTPKLYWSDVGLAMHLAGESEPRGAHLENLVLADLLAWAGAKVDGPAILYWRTAVGDEVDFVIESGDRILPIEVKAGARPRLDDARGLRAFLEAHGAKSRPGLLLHGGSELSWLADRVLAAPWWMVV